MFKFQIAAILEPSQGPKEGYCVTWGMAKRDAQDHPCSLKYSIKEREPLKRKNSRAKTPTRTSANNFREKTYIMTSSKKNPPALNKLKAQSMRSPIFSITPTNK